MVKLLFSFGHTVHGCKMLKYRKIHTETNVWKYCTHMHWYIKSFYINHSQWLLELGVIIYSWSVNITLQLLWAVGEQSEESMCLDWKSPLCLKTDSVPSQRVLLSCVGGRIVLVRAANWNCSLQTRTFLNPTKRCFYFLLKSRYM